MFTVVNETLFLEVTVKDLLWGYEDNLLKEAKKIAEAFNQTLPVPDKFGLFFEVIFTVNPIKGCYIQTLKVHRQKKRHLEKKTPAL